MSNGSGRVPVIACVRASWVFLFVNWRLFLPAAAVSAVLSEVGTAAVAFGGAPAEASLGLLVVLPMILAGLMFQGALLRKSVRDEFKPPIGLALSGDEWRLLGVGLSVTLIAMPIFFLLTAVLGATLFRQLAATPEALEALASDPGALAEAVARALGPVGSLLLVVTLIVILSIVLGLTALANAASTGEMRIIIFQAWRWISGNTLRVFATMILTVAPTLILTTVVAEIVTSGLVAISGGVVGIPAYIAASILITFANLLTSIPIAALGCTLYKGLRPAGFVAK